MDYVMWAGYTYNDRSWVYDDMNVFKCSILDGKNM